MQNNSIQVRGLQKCGFFLIKFASNYINRNIAI